MASHSRAVSSPVPAIDPDSNILVSIPSTITKIVKNCEITFSLSGQRKPNAKHAQQAVVTFLLDHLSDHHQLLKVEPSLFFDEPPQAVVVDICQSRTDTSGKTLKVTMPRFNLSAIATNNFSRLYFDFSTTAMKQKQSISIQTGPSIDGQVPRSLTL